MGQARAPRSAHKKQTERREFADRVRGVLIFGVVAGHTMLVLSGAPGPIDTLADATLVIRMPAFFLVSGALLQYRPVWRQITSVAQRLGPLYLAGVTLNAFVTLIFYRQLDIKLLPPEWGLWFLLALGLLRVTSSLFPNHITAVSVAIAAAIFASVAELPQSVWLTRALMLAPFFAVGIWIGINRLERIAQQLGWINSIMLLGACALMAGIIIEMTSLTPAAYQWRQPLTAFGLSTLPAACIEIAIILAALGASFGTFGIVAQIGKCRWLEHVGKRSFVVLVGHFAIFDALRATWFPQFDSELARLSVAVGLTIVGTLVPIAALGIVNRVQSGLREHLRAI